MEKMEINNETWVKESSIDKSTPMSFTPIEGEVLEIGRKYFIRTLSYHYVGLLIGLTDTRLVLEQASWVADSGRFGEALKSGGLDEVECYPTQVFINRGVVVDESEWVHDLPTESK
jgi:hypothetical protein